MSQSANKHTPSLHVYPQRAMWPHWTEGTTCWCEPVVEWINGVALVVHRSDVEVAQRMGARGAPQVYAPDREGLAVQ